MHVTKLCQFITTQTASQCQIPVGMSSKDGEKGQHKMENVSRWEDVKVVMTMVAITLIAVIVVTVKSVILYQEVGQLHQFDTYSKFSV